MVVPRKRGENEKDEEMEFRIPGSSKPTKLADFEDFDFSIRDDFSEDVKFAISRYPALKEKGKEMLEKGVLGGLIGTGRFSAVFELKLEGVSYAVKLSSTALDLYPFRETVMGSLLSDSSLFSAERAERMATPFRTEGVGKVGDPFLHVVDYLGTASMWEDDFLDAAPKNSEEEVEKRGWGYARYLFSERREEEKKKSAGASAEARRKKRKLITAHVEELYSLGRSDQFLADRAMEDFSMSLEYSTLMFFQVGLTQVRLFEEFGVSHSDLHAGNVFAKGASRADVRLLYRSDARDEVADIRPEEYGWPTAFGYAREFPRFAIGDLGLIVAGNAWRDDAFRLERSLELDLHLMALDLAYLACANHVRVRKAKGIELPSDSIVAEWKRFQEKMESFFLPVDRMRDDVAEEFRGVLGPKFEDLKKALDEKRGDLVFRACEEIKALRINTFKYLPKGAVTKGTERTPADFRRAILDLWVFEDEEEEEEEEARRQEGPVFVAPEDPQWSTIPRVSS